MKSKIVLALSLFIMSVSTNAQNGVYVEEGRDNVNKTNGTVLKTKIKRASEKEIVKAWKSKLKDFDGDVDAKKNVITASEVKVESIGTVGLDVSAEIREVNKVEHEFVVMFIKNGEAISSSTDLSAFTAAKNIVRNFATELSKEATEGYQKAQLKIFGGFEKQLEKAKEEEEDAKEDIEDAKKDIEKAKEDIKKANEDIKKAEESMKENAKVLEKNKTKQEDISKKIATQKNIVNGANAEMGNFK